MCKRIGLLLLLVSCYSGLSGQAVSGIGFGQEGQKIVVQYNIAGAKYYQKFNAELFVSMDGGRTFDGPLKEVSGDVGMGIVAGSGKKIVWDVLKERPDFGGNVVFDVRVRVIEEAIPKHFYIGYKGTLSAPMGVTLGITGKTGFYASARINPGYFSEYSYHTDGESITDFDGTGYYTFNGNISKRRFSLTAGLQFQMGRKVHLYLGGGLGRYDLLYEIDQFTYANEHTGTALVKHEPSSFTGLEAEAGLMFDLKPLYLSIGAASPGLRYAEPAVSVGLMF